MACKDFCKFKTNQKLHKLQVKGYKKDEAASSLSSDTWHTWSLVWESNNKSILNNVWKTALCNKINVSCNLKHVSFNIPWHFCTADFWKQLYLECFDIKTSMKYAAKASYCSYSIRTHSSCLLEHHHMKIFISQVPGTELLCLPCYLRLHSIPPRGSIMVKCPTT